MFPILTNWLYETARNLTNSKGTLIMLPIIVINGALAKCQGIS